MTDSIERVILIDEPASEDQFHGKGHRSTAQALAKAIAAFKGQDRAIGLDGPWGSGKSTVVKIAERILEEKNGPDKTVFNFFTFDIWQSHGSSFRRSLLEHLLDWAMATYPDKARRLKDVENRVKGKVRQVQSNSRSMLDWWGVLVVVFLPFLPIYYFFAKSAYDASVGKDAPSFFTSWAFLLLVAFIGGTLLWAGVKFLRERPNWRAGPVALVTKYREALSQTLLINSKQFEDQTVTQHIREIDPNDFEFQSVLREILSIVQNEKSRVVLVLDNIDRLPKKEIDECWAQVRAVFSEGPKARNAGERNPVLAIVPYSRHLIDGPKKQERDSNDSSQIASTRAAISSLASREIFAKTFDEILTVAPPVMSNSREFFIEKLKAALPGISDEDGLFRVYLIFHHVLRAENANATPRQIIAFINEIAGLFVLHSGRFRLPTVALYIAHKDTLDENPTALSERDWVDRKLRELAGDPDLERNLAAIVFNVEPDLAFQLLLDDRIRSAASSENNSLRELSQVHGFDIRVTEVVQDSVKGWQSAGDFNTVLRNFAAIVPGYKQPAKPHFSRELVAACRDISAIPLDEGNYIDLLLAFDLATIEELPALTASYLNSGLTWLTTQTADIDSGKKWADFVAQIHAKTEARGHPEALTNALSATRMSNAPAFIFGVAVAAQEAGLELSEFKPSAPARETEDTVYTDLALENPEEAHVAFRQFRLNRGLFSDDRCKAVALALVSALAANEDDTDYAALVNLLADCVAFLPGKLRKEVDVSSLFGTVEFYDNLHASMDENTVVAGSAAFLSLVYLVSDGLPTIQMTAPNGNRVKATNAGYRWFEHIFDGTTELTEKDATRAGELAKEAGLVTEWVGYLRDVPDDRLLHHLVRAAYVHGIPPHTDISYILQNHDIVRTVAGDVLPDVLTRLAVRITQSAIDKVEISMVPAEIVGDTVGLHIREWEAFQRHLEKLLDAAPGADWANHLATADRHANVLLAKVVASDFTFSGTAFRDAFQQFLVDALSGKAAVAAGFDYDRLLSAIDANFHSDLFRRVREQMPDASVDVLRAAADAFPVTLDMIISGASKLSKAEKDNLVRSLLCPALEGGVERVLDIFLHVGTTKVREWIKSSPESTRARVDGAWSVYRQSDVEYRRQRSVGELIHGKKKLMTILGVPIPMMYEDDT